VLVAALIAVARVVTPTLVPIVVPTALRHQNTAIAVAAMVLAKSFGRDSERPTIVCPSLYVGYERALGDLVKPKRRYFVSSRP
jgi:hypothetical protein